MRVELGGLGDPIPTEAFPVGDDGGKLPQLALMLEDGQVFVPGDYISLGYTHYEVWVVGAAGGQGGNADDLVKWDIETSTESIPDEVWIPYYNDILANKTQYAEFLSQWLGYGVDPAESGWPTPYSAGGPGASSWPMRDMRHPHPKDPSPGSFVPGWQNFIDWAHPGRLWTVKHYSNPRVVTHNPQFGGGGGGGGFQRVSGILTDLPEEIDVAVGQAGVNAPFGQNEVNGPMDWGPPVTDQGQPGGNNKEHGGLDGWSWAHRYPDPKPMLYPPSAGGDGGHSAFGDIAKASGGKGGGPAIQWSATAEGVPVAQLTASGGRGGIGGSDVAGGGGLGAFSLAQIPPDGSDGQWNKDTEIGQGGGGSRGGQPPVLELVNYGMVGERWTRIRDVMYSSGGGRGSFSYDDTSVYGPRDNGDTVYAAIAFHFGGHSQVGSYNDNYWVYGVVPAIAGGGGSVKLPGKRFFGSQAPSYNRNGAVLLRLIAL